jgi:hypothetical protein
MNAGEKGTKKLVERFGDRLVCVRYRYDYENMRKMKTVELIIEEGSLPKTSSRIPLNKIMKLSVAYEEFSIRRLIRSVGGRWNSQEKVWELPYRQVLSLGLQERIVKKK